ncbi:hypothetical protein [Nonomuraea sp. bgisy101]|uniref:hypothetical protein n=1 Tax=Nonomuraea sp. bgisy101 TaxID=3413784 RepID=UPI003D7393F4
MAELIPNNENSRPLVAGGRAADLLCAPGMIRTCDTRFSLRSPLVEEAVQA